MHNHDIRITRIRDQLGQNYPDHFVWECRNCGMRGVPRARSDAEESAREHARQAGGTATITMPPEHSVSLGSMMGKNGFMMAWWTCICGERGKVEHDWATGPAGDCHRTAARNGKWHEGLNERATPEEVTEAISSITRTIQEQA